MKAEDVATPDHPMLSVYEAGRWYALHGRPYPAGATPECRAGWYDVMERLGDVDDEAES